MRSLNISGHVAMQYTLRAERHMAFFPHNESATACFHYRVQKLFSLAAFAKLVVIAGPQKIY